VLCLTAVFDTVFINHQMVVLLVWDSQMLLVQLVWTV